MGSVLESICNDSCAAGASFLMRSIFQCQRSFFRWDHLQRKDRCCGVTSPFVFAMVQIPSIIRDVEIEAWAERRLSAHSRAISMCSFDLHVQFQQCKERSTPCEDK